MVGTTLPCRPFSPTDGRLRIDYIRTHQLERPFDDLTIYKEANAAASLPQGMVLP